jgi:hypothetical protein
VKVPSVETELLAGEEEGEEDEVEEDGIEA